MFAKSQVSRVFATAPGAGAHRARHDLAAAKPGTNAARIFPPCLAQVALGAAVAQRKVWRVPNAGVSGGMAQQHHAATSTQQALNGAAAGNTFSGAVSGKAGSAGQALKASTASTLRRETATSDPIADIALQVLPAKPVAPLKTGAAPQTPRQS